MLLTHFHPSIQAHAICLFCCRGGGDDTCQTTRDLFRVSEFRQDWHKRFRFQGVAEERGVALETAENNALGRVPQSFNSDSRRNDSADVIYFPLKL